MAAAAEDNLSCAVCLEIYHDPRRLLCGHSYCLKCIMDVQAKCRDQRVLTCPICQTESMLEHCDESSFMKNCELHSLVMSYKKEQIGTNQSTESCFCDICECDPPTPAHHSCVDCEVMYCDACLDTYHPQKGKLAKHKIVVIDENFKRRQHLKNDDGSVYCKECDLLVLGTDTDSHNDHEVMSLVRAQLMFKVLHSQRLSEKPLNPWIIAEKTGTILTAHCDCMAGIGESCTHVGALLFKLDAAVRIRDAKTVTQEKAYWLLPTNLNTTGYSQVCDTDFTSARTMKKQLDCKVDNLSSMHSPSPSTRTNTTPAKKKVIPTTSLAEMTTFYERLNVANSKAAILSVLPVYCDQFIPVSIRDDYPQLLTELNDDRANQMNFGELALHCSKISITATKRQRVNVEQDTRGQSSSKLWFHCRAGRITASRMKRVCHTDIHKPSQSLIKQICYPGEIKFKNEATEWGCSHESVALDKYKEYMVDHHEDFEILPAGLFLDADDPFIGASPDAIVNCKCCGRGCVEVKCPFCARDSELDSVKKSSWCLDETDGIRKLKRNHEYYYQVMSQINVCNVEYCDFVVWTTKDVHYERIECDAEFWAEAKQKATQFFRLCVLPELVGHFYSRPSSASVNENIDLSNICIATEPSPDVWCYCKQGESDTMIACDNVDCRVKWFHTSCLMMQKIPKGKWICPDCAKLRKFCRIKYHKI